MKLKYLCIGFVILSILLCGCLNNNSHETDNKSSNWYSKYTVEILTFDSATYEIIIPIVIEEDGNVSEIMKNIEPIGNAHTELINTTNGKGLKLIGEGNISINNEIKQNVVITWLSCISEETGGGNVIYLVYKKNTNNNSMTIKVHAETFYENKIYLSYFNKTINNDGWNKVDGIKTIKIS